ncbi:MAG: type I 3-dehydroquinate dehydratase [Methanobacterium sp.]
MPVNTMICVPILQPDLKSARITADKALKLGADILEFRIDALQDPDVQEVINFIDSLDGKVIATNRTSREGGLFKGSEEERTEILSDVAGHTRFVDIELQTEEKLRSRVIKKSGSSIVSFHDFEKTPSVDELLKIVRQERELGDLAKFAVMPRSLEDTLTIFQVLLLVEDTIGISMGDLGGYTRVTAGLFGSPITYASLDGGSAPGQLDLKTTRLFLDKFTGVDR